MGKSFIGYLNRRSHLGALHDDAADVSEVGGDSMTALCIAFGIWIICCIGVTAIVLWEDML